MHERGLEDLVVIVVNQRLEEDVLGIAELEDYSLPVLQDTDEAQVFNLWDGVAYDLFIVAREGQISWTIKDAHPLDTYDGIVWALSEYLPEEAEL